MNCKKFVTVGDCREQLGLNNCVLIVQEVNTVLLSANAVLAARSAAKDIICQSAKNLHREIN